MRDKTDNFPQAIVTLAHGLGLDVIAEGIETAEDVHRLKSMMCESGQGFYFAKPLDPEEVAAYMRTPANNPRSQIDHRDAAKRFLHLAHPQGHVEQIFPKAPIRPRDRPTAKIHIRQ